MTLRLIVKIKKGGIKGMIYPNLLAEISRVNLSVPKLAEAINMSANTLYPKLNGLREFKLDEMENIKSCLLELAAAKGLEIDSNLEYLFSRDYSAK